VVDTQVAYHDRNAPLIYSSKLKKTICTKYNSLIHVISIFWKFAAPK